MVEQHTRTRVTHDSLGFLAFFRLIAVDQAMGAGCLLLLEGTLIQSHSSVFQKLGAFWAEFPFPPVFVLAVNLNHRFDGFFLPLHSRMFTCHSRNVPLQ